MKSPKTNSIKTVLTISTGFAIIFWITKMDWAIITSMIVGVLGLSSPAISNWINFIWMKLALVLSYIVPNILLSSIFYLLLFPIALLSKITSKKDNLHLKKGYSSLWIDTTRTIDKAYFEKIW